MIGYNINLYSSDTANDFTNIVQLHVLGLDLTPTFIKAGERAEHGGYRRSKTLERKMTLNLYPMNVTDYYNQISTLMTFISKEFVYFDSGDFVVDLTPTDKFRIVPTGTTIEHDYANGNKSIDIEVAIYE